MGVRITPGGSGGKKDYLPLLEFDLRKIKSFISRKLFTLKDMCIDLSYVFEKFLTSPVNNNKIKHIISQFETEF